MFCLIFFLIKMHSEERLQKTKKTIKTNLHFWSVKLKQCNIVYQNKIRLWLCIHLTKSICDYHVSVYSCAVGFKTENLFGALFLQSKINKTIWWWCVQKNDQRLHRYTHTHAHMACSRRVSQKSHLWTNIVKGRYNWAQLPLTFLIESL